MCFSATASFGAGAVLLAIGIVSVKKSASVPQKVLSCVPLIFSVQQFTEGVLWLSMAHSVLTQWREMATYVFLAFAQVVWPVMVPLSVMLLEKDPINKRILKGFLALGITVSLYLAYCLLFYKVEASVSSYHIQYDVDYPRLFRHSGALYFMATVLPSVITSIKSLRLLGVIIFLSYVVTIIFYERYLVSVWCYFAAIISIVVLSVITEMNRVPKFVPGTKPL